ncbi:hypothetical protein H4R35_001213 [Dimargaris xerosporica]|nr:hypothetical protein H4R35_001213 [Dimargaris xerosporica]
MTGGGAKRKQVKNACVNCQKACKKCDDNRPCERCRKYGLESTCRNSTRKERKKGIKRGPYKRRLNRAGVDNPQKSLVANAASMPSATPSSDGTLLQDIATQLATPQVSPTYPAFGYATPQAPSCLSSGEDTVDDTQDSKLNILSELCSAVLDTRTTEPHYPATAGCSPRLMADLRPDTRGSSPTHRLTSQLYDVHIRSPLYSTPPASANGALPRVMPSASAVRSSAPTYHTAGARPLGLSSSSRASRRRSHTIGGVHLTPESFRAGVVSQETPSPSEQRWPEARFTPSPPPDAAPHSATKRSPPLRNVRSASSIGVQLPLPASSSLLGVPDSNHTRYTRPGSLFLPRSSGSTHADYELPPSSSTGQANDHGRSTMETKAHKRQRSYSVTAYSHLSPRPPPSKSLARVSDPNLRSTSRSPPMAHLGASNEPSSTLSPPTTLSFLHPHARPQRSPTLPQLSEAHSPYGPATAPIRPSSKLPGSLFSGPMALPSPLPTPVSGQFPSDHAANLSAYSIENGHRGLVTAMHISPSSQPLPSLDRSRMDFTSRKSPPHLPPLHESIPHFEECRPSPKSTASATGTPTLHEAEYNSR